MYRLAGMLEAAGSRQFGRLYFRSCILVDRDLHVQAVERSGLVFDTRFVPPLPEPARDVQLLWFIASGRVLLRRDGGSLGGLIGGDADGWHQGPCVVRLTEAEFTGADDRRTIELASTGDPFRAVEMRFRGEHAGPRLPSEAGLVNVDAAVWSAVETLLARIDNSDSPGAAAARRLLRAVEACGLVAPTLEQSLVVDEPTGLRAIWMMVSLAFRGLRTSATLKELAGVAVSTRRAERLLQQLAEQRLLQFTGWRSGLIQLRLGLASLLLSVPELTIKEVAAEVGYRNAEALTNAYQHAGLPSPTDIKGGHRRRAATAPVV